MVAVIVCNEYLQKENVTIRGQVVQWLRGTFNDPWNYVFVLWSLSRRMAENTHRRKWKIR
jgi:hypothetical protein